MHDKIFCKDLFMIIRMNMSKLYLEAFSSHSLQQLIDKCLVFFSIKHKCIIMLLVTRSVIVSDGSKHLLLITVASVIVVVIYCNLILSIN